MIFIVDYDEMPEQRVEWDARQQYVRKLETLNSFADYIRMQIELKVGSTKEVVWYYKTYFSLVRRLYKNIRFHFDDDDRKKIESRFDEIEKKMSYIRGDNLRNIMIPMGIENEIEELQDEINQKRFEVGLIIPIKKPTRFGPTEGYDESE